MTVGQPGAAPHPVVPSATATSFRAVRHVQVGPSPVGTDRSIGVDRDQVLSMTSRGSSGSEMSTLGGARPTVSSLGRLAKMGCSACTMWRVTATADPVHTEQGCLDPPHCRHSCYPRVT